MGRGAVRRAEAEFDRAWAAEDWDRATEAGERLVALGPDGRRGAERWFNAALAAKFAQDWPRALHLGREAAARVPRGREDPAFWNLGIAATVLRDWSTARDAWSGYGLELEPGDGPIEQDLGTTGVRIETADGHEVVWAQRLCPTRARVLNVPIDPARRCGEVVVHDGAPHGERVVDGEVFPVFDELVLFEASDVPTLAVSVDAPSADVDALMTLVGEQHGLGVEQLGLADDLDMAESEGRIEKPDTAPTAGASTIVLGAPADVARRLLDEWRSEHPDLRSWTDLRTYLGDGRPTERVAYTTAPVLDGEAVVWVLHDEDGDLQLFGPTPVSEEEGRMVHLQHLLDADPTLRELLSMPRRHCAARDGAGLPWVIAPEPPDRRAAGTGQAER